MVLRALAQASTNSTKRTVSTAHGSLDGNASLACAIFNATAAMDWLIVEAYDVTSGWLDWSGTGRGAWAWSAGCCSGSSAWHPVATENLRPSGLCMRLTTPVFGHTPSSIFQ